MITIITTNTIYLKSDYLLPGIRFYLWILLKVSELFRNAVFLFRITE